MPARHFLLLNFFYLLRSIVQYGGRFFENLFYLRRWRRMSDAQLEDTVREMLIEHFWITLQTEIPYLEEVRPRKLTNEQLSWLRTVNQNFVRELLVNCSYLELFPRQETKWFLINAQGSLETVKEELVNFRSFLNTVERKMFLRLGEYYVKEMISVEYQLSWYSDCWRKYLYSDKFRRYLDELAYHQWIQNKKVV